MKRRSLAAFLVLASFFTFVGVRCDRRTAGEAATVGPRADADAGISRLDLRFPCGSAQCAGWLYLPAGNGSPAVVVMAHGFAGTRDVGLPLIAERLARDGLAAFVFDYRYFGASGGLPRQVVDVSEQIEDWHAALAFVRGRADVDGKRVALFGSSLGGGHALIVAAADGNVRAVVAQAPLIDTNVDGEATFYGAAWVARLLLTAWGDFFLSAFGADPVEIAAIAPPGGFGMIVDESAYRAVEKLVIPGSTYHNGVAARSIFLFDDYNPADHTANIAAPVLLIASHTDRFAPFSVVQAYADRSPTVTIETFEGDHFDVYLPPAVDRAAAAASHFLSEKLGTKAP